MFVSNESMLLTDHSLDKFKSACNKCCLEQNRKLNDIDAIRLLMLTTMFVCFFPIKPLYEIFDSRKRESLYLCVYYEIQNT